MRGSHDDASGHVPKPDIDDLIYGDADAPPSER